MWTIGLRVSMVEEKGGSGSESRVGRLLSGPVFYVLGPLVLGLLIWLLPQNRSKKLSSLQTKKSKKVRSLK